MALILSACANTKPADADLVVLYTTDVHGAILDFDIKRNAPARTSLANVSTYLKQMRELNPGKVLLFDTGDFLQGQPSVYYYNFVDTTTTHLCARTYNYLGYDAIGVGNHDIEAGEEVYAQRLPPQFKMPWICANAIDTRTDQPMFQPYAIIERQGVKVAVLSLITPNIGAWLPKRLWRHLRFDDMVETAQKWVPIIQKEEHPDLLIGLFHAGADYTMDGTSDFNTPYNENGSIPTAVKVPGFDLCLLGHDHMPAEMERLNVDNKPVAILDAGTQAFKVGRADIHMKLRPDGTYDKVIHTQLVDMLKYEPDSDYVKAFHSVVDTVNNYVNEPLGALTAPLRGIDGLVGPSEFIDLIHDVQLWATEADVSLTAVLSPNDTVPAGAITMRHLFTLYKYENLLYTIGMTASEIQRFLEFGYSMQFNTMLSHDDHLMNWLPTEAGKRPKLAGITFNFTSAAGIRYEVDLTKRQGDRVRLISMSDGSPIDPNRIYHVAISSYQYSGGGNFIPIGLGWDKDMLESRTIDTTPIDVRRYLAQYIQQHKVITPHLRGDWKLVPTDWWQEARERDLQILLSPMYH